MRTTLSIDDDVLMAVRERARREGRSLGQVLSELARQALTGGPDGRDGGADRTGESHPLHGFAPFPHRGPAVSNELIDQLREDEPE